MTHAGFFHPQELIAHVAVRPGMQAADFGCGSGEMALALAHLVGPTGNVTAIDVLQSALESVQSKAKHGRLQNIQTIRGNLEVPGSSALKDGSQDVVVMSNILWQSSKKAEVLAEAVRVLKPGGTLVAIEWDANKSSLGPPQESRMDKAVLQKLVTSSGLHFTAFFPAGAFHYGLIATK